LLIGCDKEIDHRRFGGKIGLRLSGGAVLGFFGLAEKAKAGCHLTFGDRHANNSPGCRRYVARYIHRLSAKWWLRKILQGKAMCDDCAERHELLHAAVRPQLRDDQSEEKEVTRTRELAA
jgi:hypothetical protein